MLTGETDALLYQGTQSKKGINLFGFGSTGRMIPLLKASAYSSHFLQMYCDVLLPKNRFNGLEEKVEFIFYSGYKTGGSDLWHRSGVKLRFP